MSKLVITWSDSSLPNTSFTIKVKDATNNSTHTVTIPANTQSSSYTTNISTISGHSYWLVSCSPTKYNNVNYSVFTGFTNSNT